MLPGQVKTLPITFTPGSDSVTMLQFDLSFPPNLIFSFLGTGSVVEAAKSVRGNSANGVLRVLIFGSDNQTIGSGTITNLQVGVMPGVSAGAMPLKISGLWLQPRLLVWLLLQGLTDMSWCNLWQMALFRLSVE